MAICKIVWIFVWCQLKYCSSIGLGDIEAQSRRPVFFPAPGINWFGLHKEQFVQVKTPFTMNSQWAKTWAKLEISSNYHTQYFFTVRAYICNVRQTNLLRPTQNLCLPDLDQPLAAALKIRWRFAKAWYYGWFWVGLCHPGGLPTNKTSKSVHGLVKKKDLPWRACSSPR